MFEKKVMNIPENLEELCNFKPTVDDWALIEEAFVYAISHETFFKMMIETRNPKKHKKLWKRYLSLRKENGHSLIGFLFMKRSPETADNVCERFRKG